MTNRKLGIISIIAGIVAIGSLLIMRIVLPSVFDATIPGLSSGEYYPSFGTDLIMGGSLVTCCGTSLLAIITGLITAGMGMLRNNIDKKGLIVGFVVNLIAIIMLCNLVFLFL